MSTSYQPSAEVLEKYAQVLIRFALNSGDGLKKGEVVQLAVPDVAKPLLFALHKEVLKADGYPLVRLLPTGIEKDFYNLATPKQLKFFPRRYYRSLTNLIDHQVGIIADVDPEELKDVDPKKITTARDARDQYRQWLFKKELNGKLTWTVGLWGTQAKADEVGLSLEEYWQQIIKACFLDKADPIAEWKQVNQLQAEIKNKLNEMEIEWLEIKGTDVDLKVQLGTNRLWQAGGGRNIPSFELFTSPNWHGTSGWIRFNQPLYRYGNVLRDISLKFADGLIVEANARVGNTLLQQLLKSKNADKIGEYSLTDKRMSRITHVMAETLFDENIGGPYGNTHLAIGMAYKDCYRGEAAKLTKAEWEELGYNDSPEHTDIISTTDRTVTAKLSNGVEKVIYKNGMFVV